MTTTENQQQMRIALNRAKADIASLTDWMQCELEKPYDNATWATVGSLDYVRGRLIDALEHLSGLEQDEIKRSLEELHS